MTKDRKKRKTALLLLVLLLALAFVAVALLLGALPDEVRRGETAVEQTEHAAKGEGTVKLCYTGVRERVQGLVDALEGLGLKVEPVPLILSFERSKLYITDGARRVEDVKALLPHAAVSELAGEAYDYIIYIGTDYES